jgi:uncharacterized sulfatase
VLFRSGRLAPQTSDIPVSSLDLLPTILKACGNAAPPGLPGLDLTDGPALVARPAIHGECYTHDIVDLLRPEPNLRWRWIIREGWKLIVPAPQNEPGGVELYRLADDPQEERNLAAADPVRVASLRASLDAWWSGRDHP